MGDIIDFPAPKPARRVIELPSVSIPAAMLYDNLLPAGAIVLYATLVAENTDLVKAAQEVRRMHRHGDVSDWLTLLEARGYIK